MTQVTLLLGSNKGERERNIRSALNLLDIALGGHYRAISPIVETKSCDFDGPDFLNCVVRYDTVRQPFPLLKLCKAVERNLGRDETPEFDGEGNRVYHDRVIDVDILFYGNRRIESEILTIPHPQVKSRPFVCELLAKLEEVC